MSNHSDVRRSGRARSGPLEAVDTAHSLTYVVHREQYGDDWTEAAFRDRSEAEAYIERYYASVGGRDDDWSLYIADEPLPDSAHTRPTILAAGLYLSMPHGHAQVSDGDRSIVVTDLGGVIYLGGIKVTDPAILDGLGDHLKLLAGRRRRDIAEPYHPGSADATRQPLSLDLPA